MNPQPLKQQLVSAVKCNGANSLTQAHQLTQTRNSKPCALNPEPTQAAAAVPRTPQARIWQRHLSDFRLALLKRKGFRPSTVFVLLIVGKGRFGLGCRTGLRLLSLSSEQESSEAQAFRGEERAAMRRRQASTEKTAGPEKLRLPHAEVRSLR